jgi:acid phosphatase (class A)
MKAAHAAGLAFCAIWTSFVVQARAQQLEATARPKDEARPAPYLADRALNYRLVLGAPPPLDSVPDQQDVISVRRLQHVGRARWLSANEDAAFVYPRFDDAFGRPVDRTTSPVMIVLLNRAIRDVSKAAFAAKEHYSRPRPYQRYQLRRICGGSKAPKPEAQPAPGSSYPSGHSAYGWTTALILARLEPDRAEMLFQRADEYAQSRLVCGVHFPSDIAAGRLIATAVVSRLDADPAFQADLEHAKAELRVKSSPGSNAD